MLSQRPLWAAMQKTDCWGNPNYVMLVWLIPLGHVELFCSDKEEGNGLSIADYIRGLVYSKVVAQSVKYNYRLINTTVVLK